MKTFKNLGNANPMHLKSFTKNIHTDIHSDHCIIIMYIFIFPHLAPDPSGHVVCCNFKHIQN